MLALLVRGYHPLRLCFPDRFQLSRIDHWPGPRSLATTNGVSVDVLSSRYLDVSVPWVRLKPPMNSGVSYLHLITGNPKPHGLVSHIAVRTPRHKALEFQLSKVGFPIRKSVDQSFFAAPHGLSQRSTSFIASQRQGIHRMPLRHLIALIINTHPGHEARTVLILKDQLASAAPLRHPQTLCGNAMARCSEIAYAIATCAALATLGAILPLHDVR